jgi:competence protein ComGC
MKTKTHHQSGLSLVEVALVIATVALLAIVFLPMLARSRCRSSKLGCTNSLKQVGLAFQLYSNDHNDKFPFAVSTADGGTQELTNSAQAFQHFQAISNELNTPKILVCPMDSTKRRALDFLNAVNGTSFNSNSNLSYFVALDADESKAERLLSGDRNITGGSLSNGLLSLLRPTTKAGWTSEMHNHSGNIGLAGGSVVQTDPIVLRRLLRTNTLPIIRLAIP